jgi:hypothetical protein
MSPAPKHTRRWLQFGLGTMLVVVTVFALGLGWMVSISQQCKRREACLDELAERGGNWGWPSYSRLRPRPYVEYIQLPSDRFSAEDVQRVQSIFPEARIDVYDDPLNRP